MNMINNKINTYYVYIYCKQLLRLYRYPYVTSVIILIISRSHSSLNFNSRYKWYNGVIINNKYTSSVVTLYNYI